MKNEVHVTFDFATNDAKSELLEGFRHIYEIDRIVYNVPSSTIHLAFIGRPNYQLSSISIFEGFIIFNDQNLLKMNKVYLLFTVKNITNGL